MYYDDIIEEMLLEDYLNDYDYLDEGYNYLDELLEEAYLEGLYDYYSFRPGNSNDTIRVGDLDKEGRKAFKNYAIGNNNKSSASKVLNGVSAGIGVLSTKNAIKGVKQLKKINNPEEFDKMYEKYLIDFESRNINGQPLSKEEYKKFLKSKTRRGLAFSAISMGIGAKSAADLYRSTNKNMEKNVSKLNTSVARYYANKNRK